MSYWPNQMIYYLSTSGTNNLSLIPGNTVTLPTQTNLPYLSTGEIFTTGPIVFSGGDYLSTIGGELVYNGIPVVQYSTLSSLNEWSFEPAISSINVAGNNILNANITDTNIANISTGNISTINTNNISTNFLTASSITTSSLNVTNLNYISTYTYTSTISSIQFEGDKADIDQMTISSLNGVPVSQVITPYTLPADIVCSTLYADTSISTATLFTGGLGSRVRLGGIPDTPLTFTSFANSQTHGAATGNYTINAFAGDIVMNGSNDILINGYNDFTVTSGDINLTQTDPTSIFNITTTGAGVMAFGLALDITTTSYLAINSGGNVDIGSANLLGARTSIEKVSFKENQIYKQLGYNDLEISDVSTINATTDLNFDVAGSINTNGSVVNLTGSELHNASLIHSRNNQNLILEGKGNGIINISSISTVVSKYFQPDSMGVSSINASSMTINNLQTSNYISSATENTVSSLSRVLQTSSILASTINAISTITTHNQVSSIFISTLCAGGLSTGQALLTLRGGNSATAVNGTPQLSFDWSQTNGGFTHWMTTRHNSMASNAGNAIDFWINNSTIYNGSTYPAIGNCNILSITGAGVGINVSSPAFALEVSGAIRNTTFISTVSSINNLVFTSTLATNTISSQLLNISTVSARAVTATALNYPAVAVTSSGNNTLTVVDTHTYLINTYGGAGNATWTLPTASSYQGRIIFIKNNAATPQIVSNANNVIPQAGGAAGTLICAAGTGKFSVIVSDGSNWVVMMSN